MCGVGGLSTQLRTLLDLSKGGGGRQREGRARRGKPWCDDGRRGLRLVHVGAVGCWGASPGLTREREKSHKHTTPVEDRRRGGVVRVRVMTARVRATDRLELG